MLAAIGAGADVNVQANFDKFMSPLVRAAACGHVSTVKLLIAHGADVNAGPGYDLPSGGWIVVNHPPLIAAAEQGHEDIVEILLAHGADPNAQDQVIPNPNAEKPERRPWDTPLLVADNLRVPVGAMCAVEPQHAAPLEAQVASARVGGLVEDPSRANNASQVSAIARACYSAALSTF